MWISKLARCFLHPMTSIFTWAFVRMKMPSFETIWCIIRLAPRNDTADVQFTLANPLRYWYWLKWSNSKYVQFAIHTRLQSHLQIVLIHFYRFRLLWTVVIFVNSDIDFHCPQLALSMLVAQWRFITSEWKVIHTQWSHRQCRRHHQRHR